MKRLSGFLLSAIMIFSITEWQFFQTKQDMLDVCRIPEEKLNNMMTEALLETVLQADIKI